MVNDLYKLVCIGNPKVASSSLKTIFLKDLEDSELFSSRSFKQFAKMSNVDVDKYEIIAFTRDPAERVFSCWQDKISNQKRFADMFIITRYRGLYPDMSFADFVNWLCSEEGQDCHADRHWISQYKIFESDSVVAKKIKFYDLALFSDVWEQLQIKHDLPQIQYKKINTLSERADTPDRIIPATSKELIKKRYLEDYRLFYRD